VRISCRSNEYGFDVNVSKNRICTSNLGAIRTCKSIRGVKIGVYNRRKVTLRVGCDVRSVNRTDPPCSKNGNLVHQLLKR
jgi:hypothetical protein